MSTILLAEDDPFLRKAFAKALKRLADVVLEAENGLEAKALLEDHPEVDLIISDWMMPQMTGPELLEFAKRENAYRHIPFVIVTARESVNDAIACLEQGANEYLRKPCHINELLARARNMLKVKEYQDELQRLAKTDGLTGLYNHSYFITCLDREVERIERYGGSLGLMLFDIDYFKKFNDTYGHQTGDFILSEMGVLTRQGIRRPDVAARYGGEEFAVILSGKDNDNLMIPAERMLKAVDKHDFAYEDRIHHITVSIGLTQFHYGDSGTELISRADGALYQAKNNGRNCICQA